MVYNPATWQSDREFAENSAEKRRWCCACTRHTHCSLTPDRMRYTVFP